MRKNERERKNIHSHKKEVRKQKEIQKATKRHLRERRDIEKEDEQEGWRDTRERGRQEQSA